MNQHSPISGDVSASPLVRMAYDDPLTFGWRIRALLELLKQDAPKDMAEDEVICLVNLGLHLRDKHGASTCHAVCMYLDGTLDWPVSLLLALPGYFRQNEVQLCDSLTAPAVETLVPGFRVKHENAMAAVKKPPPAPSAGKPAACLSPRAEHILAEMNARARQVKTPPAPEAEPSAPLEQAAKSDTKAPLAVPPVSARRKPRPVETPVVVSPVGNDTPPAEDAVPLPTETPPAEDVPDSPPPTDIATEAPTVTEEVAVVSAPQQDTSAIPTTVDLHQPLDPRLVEILRIANVHKGVPLNKDIQRLRKKLDIPHTELAKRLKDAGCYPDKSPEQVQSIVNNTLSGLVRWSHLLMKGLLVAFQCSEDDMVHELTHPPHKTR